MNSLVTCLPPFSPLLLQLFPGVNVKYLLKLFLSDLSGVLSLLTLSYLRRCMKEKAVFILSATIPVPPRRLACHWGCAGNFLPKPLRRSRSLTGCPASNTAVWTRTLLEEESPGGHCFKVTRHVRLHHSARKRIEHSLMSNFFAEQIVEQVDHSVYIFYLNSFNSRRKLKLQTSQHSTLHMFPIWLVYSRKVYSRVW